MNDVAPLDASMARRERHAALISALAQGRTQISERSFGKPLAWSFYALLIIAILWPRYFYLSLPGLPGLSAFVLYSMAFALVITPFALYSTNAIPPFLRIIQRSPVLVGIFLLFVFWRMLTSAIAPPLSAETSWFTFTRIFLPIGVYFVISAVFFMDRDIYRTSLRVLLVLIIIAGLGGVAEVEMNMRLLKILGLNESAAGGRLADSFMNNFYRDGSLRAQSVFTQPLVFGQFMAAFAPLCVALFFNESKKWRAVAAIAFTFCLYSVFISTSRSALIGSFVAGLTFIMLMLVNRFRYRWIMLAGLALLLCIATISAFQLGEFAASVIGSTRNNVESANLRQVMVAQSLKYASEAPVFGYGDGSAKWLGGLSTGDGLATIDSQFLSVLLHNGYPGLILWTSFLVVMIIMAVRNAMEGSSPVVRAVNSAIAAFVAAMMMGFSVLSIEDNMVMVYLFAGMVMVDRSSTRSVSGKISIAAF